MLVAPPLIHLMPTRAAIIPHAIQMVDRLLPMSSVRVFEEMIQVCERYSLLDEVRFLRSAARNGGRSNSLGQARIRAHD